MTSSAYIFTDQNKISCGHASEAVSSYVNSILLVQLFRGELVRFARSFIFMTTLYKTTR